MKASLKPGYLKLNIAATAVGKEERKMLLITTCWMKASNALDDGHLMPSNPLFKRHWRFVLNLNLKFQKGGPLGIPRATTPGPAEEGQPREVPGPVGNSYETPTITFHHAQYMSKSTPSLCTFPSEGRPARPNSRQLFESHPNATPTSWAFPARNAFSGPLYGIIDVAVTWPGSCNDIFGFAPRLNKKGEIVSQHIRG